MKALILAGGKGTRLLGITNDEIPSLLAKLDALPTKMSAPLTKKNIPNTKNTINSGIKNPLPNLFVRLNNQFNILSLL